MLRESFELAACLARRTQRRYGRIREPVVNVRSFPNVLTIPNRAGRHGGSPNLPDVDTFASSVSRSPLARTCVTGLCVEVVCVRQLECRLLASLTESLI